MPRKKPQAEETDQNPSATQTGAQAAPRVIKKYPNRRLYDTASSSYITLAEVKQLVLESKPFTVRDAKTGDDLTRSILLQIILEEEAGGTPMLSEAALANIIRFYGHAMQGFMGNYLEKNVQAFTDLQSKLTEQSRTLTPEMWAQFMSMPNPFLQGLMGMGNMGGMGAYADQSKAMIETMLNPFGVKR